MYKSKREEIESLAEENLRRKRQRRAYAQLEAKIRKDIEAEYRSGPVKTNQIQNGPLHIPKFLILLITIGWLLTAGIYLMTGSRADSPPNTLLVIITCLAAIPLSILWLYIWYLLVYLLYRVYWWFHLIMGLLTVIAMIYLFVGAIYGQTLLGDAFQRVNDVFAEFQALGDRIENRSFEIQQQIERVQIPTVQPRLTPFAPDQLSIPGIEDFQGLMLQLTQLNDIGLAELERLEAELEKLAPYANEAQMTELRNSIADLKRLINNFPQIP